jgi:hypothetical protein
LCICVAQVYIEHFHSILQKALNGSDQQKNFEVLRHCSLAVQHRRDLLRLFKDYEGPSKDSKRFSEIKEQVIRFWDKTNREGKENEKGKEYEWVQQISSNHLEPLFMKLFRTNIPNKYNELLDLYRPIELIRSNIHFIMNYFKMVLHICLYQLLLYNM